MSDFGSAVSKTFMLGEATVMLGAQADLYLLTPNINGVGLVKNFSLKGDVGFVDLTQGVQNQIIDSTKNKSQLNSTFEVYEYTAKNIAYALGIDGSSIVTSTLVATTTASAVTGTVASPDMSLPLTSATEFGVGNWILAQGATADQIYVDKIASIATNVLTLTYGIPDSLASGALVRLATNIDLASTVDQPYLSMAAVGKLRDGTLVRVNVPKIRITKGFTMAFDTKNYGNLPFEATVYNLVQSDPNYANFRTRAAELVMA
ncbi:hypothetical protein [Telmatospirillum sp.]|uniref:hypothetical protein n=1 Tax=Telmatospirillum sp. TaxID=2079197 RepID=UPI00283B34FE|nr:hypothetical protein [Telmatospirillum sp.]MDR3436434.1 hypothetical protein [Telmatospirillum sp.]